jgi:putative glycosyltransferase
MTVPGANGASPDRQAEPVDLSIVATLYRSEGYIEEFVERSLAAAGKLVKRVEIILVNDCSPDASLDKSLELQQKFPEIRVVDLAINAGHHRAMMVGLCFARGARVFLIDVDLEEDPEWLLPFWQKMEDDRLDVVFGIQRERKGALVERVFGSLFYSIVNFSGERFQADSVTARLMSQRYVAALTTFQEREFAIGDLWVRAGFAQASLQVEKKSRGTSSYTFRKRAKNAVLGIVSTSTLPLSAIFLFGLAVCVLSILYITFLLVRYLVFGSPIEGWLSLILSVWLLGGATQMALGIIGLYLARIFYETKRRPYAVLRGVHDAAGNLEPAYPIDGVNWRPSPRQPASQDPSSS